jgi:hypothetical protein
MGGKRLLTLQNQGRSEPPPYSDHVVNAMTSTELLSVSEPAAHTLPPLDVSSVRGV